MAIREKKRAYDNKGSAIITALVVSTVLMVLCLSLLAVSYSLFLSTKDDNSGINYREMLYSSAEVLESEITDKNNIELPGNSDANGVIKLNKELLDSVWKGFETDGQNYTQNTNCGEWLYYDPLASDDHNNLEKCSRYFQLKSIGSVKIIAQFYWQLPWSDTSQKWDGTDQQKLGAILHAIYRLYDNKDNVIVKTEKTYSLNAVISTGSGSGGSTGTTSPENYTINFKNGPKNTNGSEDNNNEVNTIFLPNTQYDVMGDSTPSFTPLYGSCDWYFDQSFTKKYDEGKTLSQNLSDFGITTHDITLYAYWDKNEIPIRIRYADRYDSTYNGNGTDPGKIVYVDYIYAGEKATYNNVLGDITKWKTHPKKNNSASKWIDFFDTANKESVNKCNEDIDVFAIYSGYYNGSNKNISNPKKTVPGYDNGVYVGPDDTNYGSGPVTITYDFYWERIYS